MRLAGVKRSGPGEVQVFDAGLTQASAFGLGEFPAQPREILVYRAKNAVTPDIGKTAQRQTRDGRFV